MAPACGNTFSPFSKPLFQICKTFQELHWFFHDAVWLQHLFRSLENFSTILSHYSHQMSSDYTEFLSRLCTLAVGHAALVKKKKRLDNCSLCMLLSHSWAAPIKQKTMSIMQKRMASFLSGVKASHFNSKFQREWKNRHYFQINPGISLRWVFRSVNGKSEYECVKSFFFFVVNERCCSFVFLFSFFVVPLRCKREKFEWI